MKRRCPRCGEYFEILTVDQRYDERCGREVAAREMAEARREATRRFTPWVRYAS